MHYYISPKDCADWYTGDTSEAVPRVRCSGIAPSMSVVDFDVLFKAVGQRLILSVQGSATLLPTAVLECTEALEQLHQMLIQDRNTQTGGVLREHGINCTPNCRVSPLSRSYHPRTIPLR